MEQLKQFDVVTPIHGDMDEGRAILPGHLYIVRKQIQDKVFIYTQGEESLFDRDNLTKVGHFENGKLS